MIMKIDPELLKQLDPRKSYLPKTPLPEGEETGSASRLHGHLPPPSDRTALAMLEPDSKLDSLPTDELREELHRRQRNAGRLQAEREKLIANIAALDAEIERLLGTRASSRVAPPRDPDAPREPARLVTPRPKNSLKLADAIAAAVEPGTVVTPTEVAELVKKDGYITTSKTFAQSVSATLAKHGGFSRVGRGQYKRLT